MNRQGLLKSGLLSLGVFALLFLISRCGGGGKMWGLFCPSELEIAVRGMPNYNDKRELLFGQPHLICMVRRDGERIKYVRTYWPQHTTSYNLLPQTNTLAQPSTISSHMILDGRLSELGLAVRLRTDEVWKAWWFPDGLLADAAYKSVIPLPSLESLPQLNTNLVQYPTEY